MADRYRWQLTVHVPGITVQWENETQNVPASWTHEDLEHWVFNEWLATPNGRKYGRIRGLTYRFFAVKI